MDKLNQTTNRYNAISISPANDLESNARLAETFVKERAKVLSVSLGIPEKEAERRIYKALPKDFGLTPDEEIVILEYLEAEKNYKKVAKLFYNLKWHERPLLVFRVLKLEKKWEIARAKFESIACKVFRELVNDR